MLKKYFFFINIQINKKKINKNPNFNENALYVKYNVIKFYC